VQDDIRAFFLTPKSPKQRQYEALRAYVVEGVSAQEAAERFGFTQKSLYALVHALRKGELDFFPRRTRGPKDRRLTPYLRESICQLRKENLSAKDIVERLGAKEIHLSQSTVERILKDAGFTRLLRRTRLERDLSRERMSLAAPAQNLDIDMLEPFRAECQVAGIFFFLPYIVASGLLETLDRLPLPQSNRIGKKQAFLSLLALKLVGGERLSHVRQYDHDAGSVVTRASSQQRTVVCSRRRLSVASCLGRRTSSLAARLTSIFILSSTLARLQRWRRYGVGRGIRR